MVNIPEDDDSLNIPYLGEIAIEDCYYADAESFEKFYKARINYAMQEMGEVRAEIIGYILADRKQMSTYPSMEERHKVGVAVLVTLFDEICDYSVFIAEATYETYSDKPLTQKIASGECIMVHLKEKDQPSQRFRREIVREIPGDARSPFVLSEWQELHESNSG